VSFRRCGSIAAGILVGLVVVKIGGLTIGLGSAGEILVVGILIGFLRSLNPTFGRVPTAASNVLMDLGLMFFMTGIGVQAGAGVASALAKVGLILIAGGICVTRVPALEGYFFGRRVLKLNPALLLGAITGTARASVLVDQRER
jgi:putative transport protein